ncbi:WD40 repeat-like protein [Lentinus brumalis]|uniref:WD40 repeat-like protein n=1 Tax=Lentinus brumalis TaxID=2498619 RepID=A0A371CJF5_9APHY|nr:WD40 repeat-like protein [Polyporus brumalis]
MSTSALQFLRYDLDGAMSSPDGGLALDLSEFKCLRSLEVDINQYQSSLTPEVFSTIIHTLNSSPPSTLHDLTMTFTCGHTGGVGHLAQVWKDPTAVQKCQPLEDTLIGLGTPRVFVKIPQAKRNRLAIWSKWICSCFPRLHERKLLRVQCSSDSDDGQGHLGHDAYPRHAAASPDGRYIATSAEDDTIIIWSGMPFSQTVLVEIQCPELRINPLASYTGHIRAFAFSDTGEFLAATNDIDLLIYRVADGSLVTSIQVGGPALSYAWRSDGLDHVILSILGYTGNEPTFVQLPGDPVHSASSPVAFPSLEVFLDGSESVSFLQLSPSGRTVARMQYSEPVTMYTIWRMVDSALAYEVHNWTYRCTEPDVEPSSCASLVGDDQLVVGFSDGTLHWWDISVFPLATTEPHGTLTLHPGGSYPDSAEVTCLSVSPHHSFLLVAYSDHISSHTVSYSDHISSHTVWVLRRDGNLGLGTQSGLRDVKLSLHVSLQGHTRRIAAACFSPCERYVATSSEDDTVRLWSVGDGSLVCTFVDHDITVVHLVFSPDGKTLVSADMVGRVCVHALSMFVRDAPLCLE